MFSAPILLMIDSACLIFVAWKLSQLEDEKREEVLYTEEFVTKYRTYGAAMFVFFVIGAYLLWQIFQFLS